VVVALTEQDVAEYHELLGGRVRVAAIPNTARPLNGPPIDPAVKVAVAAGRLGHLGQKGFDLLLATWARVAEQRPDWRLRIHGEGPGREELESLVRAHRLGGGVDHTGAAAAKGGAMAGGSVFVLSSARASRASP
jgi:glycosyltransferase involved in cell wall biosynthesis